MSNKIKLAIGSVLAFATLATISIEAASAAQQEICMKPQQPVTQQPVQTQQQPVQTQQQPYSSPRGIRSK